MVKKITSVAFFVAIISLIAVSIIQKISDPSKPKTDLSASTLPLQSVKDTLFNRFGAYLSQGGDIRIPSADSKNKYGLDSGKYVEIEDKVQRNQYLGSILHDHGVSYKKIGKIVKRAKGSFDVRKIKSGRPYALYKSKDSLEEVRYFVYESDPVNYVVFDLEDSIDIYKAKHQIDTVENTMYSVIHQSLYQSVIDQNKPGILVNKLVDIYDWEIDFFQIKDGDYFKLVYEELKVGDKTVDIGKIKAASLIHNDSNYMAFYYPQSRNTEYFNYKGESLRKAFLKAPLNFSRISSGFSNNRLHPVLNVRRPHHGIDYAAPSGTPVRAIGKGKVIKKAYERGGGNYLKIKHNGSYVSGYLHLRGYAKGIKYGTEVEQGEIIGYVGSTGLSTGPHLDFRMWKDGRPINHRNLDLPPVEPVFEENRAEFERVRDEMLKKLNQIHDMPV